MASVDEEILERLEKMDSGQKGALLAHLRGRPAGVHGSTLSRFFGVWTEEEGKRVWEIIERDCRRVCADGG